MFETMDVKKLSLLRELLLTKSVAESKTDSQGKSEEKNLFRVYAWFLSLKLLQLASFIKEARCKQWKV